MSSNRDANFKIKRAYLCKLLRKTPSEIDKEDFKELLEFETIISELGEKNPFIML